MGGGAQMIARHKVSRFAEMSRDVGDHGSLN